MIAIMSARHIESLLLHAERDLAFRDGDPVFRAGDAVRSLFVVRSGAARLVRRQRSGDELVLQRAAPGQLLAEASLFAPQYHCDAVADGETVLARIPKARALALHRDDPEWLQQFAAHLAGEVQRARARAELLSFKRVGERLDTWLTLTARPLPPRGEWVALAAELGVSPEALYRELARRRTA